MLSVLIVGQKFDQLRINPIWRLTLRNNNNNNNDKLFANDYTIAINVADFFPHQICVISSIPDKSFE